jgi:cysteinyl-tRNA synthetase
MKRETRARFVPKHYKRELFDKLQNLKQGSKSVEEYYKEMEQAMIRAHVHEDEEQSMARFLSGLNRPIKRVVEFQTYNNVVELVHIAQKAERQLHDDAKPSKQSTFSSKASSSALKPARFDLGRDIFSSGASSNSNVRCAAAEKSNVSPNVEKSARQTSSKSNTPAGSTSKSSGIQCFKCLGRGQVMKDCPNN